MRRAFEAPQESVVTPRFDREGKEPCFMADDNRVIRGINVRETFPFTHVFRSFRVAIHPSKLVLALLAILLLYVGGRALDWVWPESHRGIVREINEYERVRAQRIAVAETGVGAAEPEFDKVRETSRNKIVEDYAGLLIQYKVQGDDSKPLAADKASEAAKRGQHLGDLRNLIVKERDETVEKIESYEKYAKIAVDDGTFQQMRGEIGAYVETSDKDSKVKDAAREKLVKAMDEARKKQQDKEKDLKPDQKEADDTRKRDERKQEHEGYHNALQGAYEQAAATWKRAEQIEGRGLWSLFMDYEVDRVNDVVAGATHNNWFGGITDKGESGVFDSVYRFFCVAPRWAISKHLVYFCLFGALFLIVWAIFGGAIARIAAIHVARDEKISMRQALRFSSGKFLSFLFAPVIPIAIVVVVGFVISVGGLLLYIPYVGEILVGIFYFLALAGGFVMTLVALGTAGGLNLMYPTIAVEGSDSFDAISRSFSYVYARPWRMLWYTVVAIAYGALTFLFVRLFIFLTLAFAHKFTGLWVMRSGAGDQSVWSSIWPGPALMHLPYDVNSISLTYGQRIAAFFVAAWVFLAIAFLGAYLISFYFSSSTIIYYLMRREVDATELDDVYVEQSEDEFAEPAPATTTATHGSAGSVGSAAAATPQSSPVTVSTTTPTTMPTTPANEAPVNEAPVNPSHAGNPPPGQ
jgi:hypothetical protein